MSFQTRLEALAAAIGADVKALSARKSVTHQVYTAAGPVTLFVGDQRWYASAPCTVTELRGTLRVAGSSQTQVKIKKNNSWIESIAIPGSTTTLAKPPNPALTLVAGDYLSIDVGIAGTGAQDLTVQLRIEE